VIGERHVDRPGGLRWLLRALRLLRLLGRAEGLLRAAGRWLTLVLVGILGRIALATVVAADATDTEAYRQRDDDVARRPLLSRRLGRVPGSRSLGFQSRRGSALRSPR
jgi:hypothetical protein